MKTRNIVLLSFMRMFILLLQLLLIVFIFMEVSFRISENNFQVLFNDLITFSSVPGRFVLKYANILRVL